MPTYEYECRACGHSFERFQSITAAPVRTCPACRRRKVARLPGRGAAILFKGSGFYETDYRSSDSKSKAKGESEDGKSGDGKDGKKSGDGEKKDASGKGADKPTTSKKAKDA